METNTIFECPVERIYFYRNEADELLNPRGEVHDTSDLQESMRHGGLRQPVDVYEDEGIFWVVDGQRRVTAARALKWSTITARLVSPPKDEKGLLTRMITSFNRKDAPLSKLGASYDRMANEFEVDPARIAALAGKKVDEVKLLMHLARSPEAVQRRVDSGEMSLSTYQEIYRKPQEVQADIAAQEKVDLRAVRKTMKDKNYARTNRPRNPEPEDSPMDAVLTAVMEEQRDEVDAWMEATARLLVAWGDISGEAREMVTRKAAQILAQGGF